MPHWVGPTWVPASLGTTFHSELMQSTTQRHIHAVALPAEVPLSFALWLATSHLTPTFSLSHRMLPSAHMSVLALTSVFYNDLSVCPLLTAEAGLYLYYCSSGRRVSLSGASSS